MAAPGPPGPLVPVELCDVPTQRLYVASGFALLQAYKVYRLFADEVSWDQGTPGWLGWTVVDAVVVGAAIPALRIPRLRFGIPQRCVLVALVAAFNWLLFGQWSVGWASLLTVIPNSVKSVFDYDVAVLESRVRRTKIVQPQDNILGGQHTIRILPHSTAKLNPSSQCHCIRPSSSDASAVTIPVLFNNSSPYLIQYSVLDFASGETRLVNVSHKAITPLSKTLDQKKKKKTLEEWALEAEAEAEAAGGATPDAASWWAVAPAELKPGAVSHELHHRLPSANPDTIKGLERTQSLYQIAIGEIGLIRLARVLDKAGNDIRIARSDVLVVQCPDVTFGRGVEGSLVPRKARTGPHSEPAKSGSRCVGDEEDLGVQISGLAPLSLSYHREVNGVKTAHKLDGITPPHLASPLALQTVPTSEGAGPAESSLAKRLAAIPRDASADYSWAAVQTISVPLNVSLSSAGSYALRLDSVRDACGHSLDLALAREAALAGRAPAELSRVDVRNIEVYPRAQVSFAGCDVADDPVRLLRGRSVDLELRVKDRDAPARGVRAASDAPWTAKVVYTPPADAESTAGWTRDFSLSSRSRRLPVSEPGSYEIASLHGSHCVGEVLVPLLCTVVEQPLPTVSLSTSRLTDQCSGETGLQASFVLSGAAPFKIHYSVALRGSSSAPQRRVKVAQHSRDDLTIQPDTPGTWEYVFDRLDDKYYRDVRIGETFQQVVHPLASAAWRGGETEVVWSCGGETVKAQIELRGAGPFSVEYQITGDGKKERLRTVEGLKSPSATLDIKIPDRYAKSGGKFSIALVSVKDGNACKRPLTVGDLPVEVHRTKPTARFYGERVVRARQDEQVNVPLRLTGEAPWTVTYRHRDSDTTRDVVLRSPNSQLGVRKSGTYELVGMRDGRCPGTVTEGDEVKVEWLPRPRLRLADGSGELASGWFVRRPVCELTEDSVDLVFAGAPPFTAWYDIHRHGKPDGSSKEKTLQAVQSGASLPLFTTEAGVHEYEVLGLSDSVYTSRSRHGLVDAHRSGGIRVRQEIFSRPTGSLKPVSKSSFCVSESLTSSGSRGVRLELTGQAPFDVELEVVDESTKAPARFPVQVASASSLVELPHVFRTPGSHTVSLRKVVDANGCERLYDRAGPSAATVEVAEIASIAAVSQRPHHCVGDSLDFVLQGSPPWTVRYEFEGKKSSATVSTSIFSRVAKEPGLFKITGVSHQLDQCTTRVESVQKLVRAVPTVRMSSGRDVVQDLREGDQTEISFEFTGEPPFTFTYARETPGGGKVLESHTVTGIMEKTHSIYAREEGTWKVTYVQDAFCSFPPAVEVGSTAKRIKAA